MSEVERLTAENAELRQTIKEMEEKHRDIVIAMRIQCDVLRLERDQLRAWIAEAPK